MKHVKKKSAKKLVGMLLVMMLILTAVTTGFSAANTSDSNGTITIKNATNGETYKIYRVCNVEYTGNSYIYSAANAYWENFFKTSDAQKFVKYDTATKKVEWITSPADNNRTAVEFSKTIMSYLSANAAADTDTLCTKQAAASEEVVFNSVPVGYYIMVNPKGDANLYMLDTVTSDGLTISDKNNVPTLTKEIVTQTGESVGHTSFAGIGSTTYFKTTIKMDKNYTNNDWHFVLYDTMDEAFTFDGSVTVASTKGGTTSTVSSSQYQFDKTSADATFTITFDPSLIATLTKDDEITVTYSATVNEKAVNYAGNDTGIQNKTWLKYSNSVAAAANSPAAGTPSAGFTTTVTAETKTVTNIFWVDVVKVNGEKIASEATNNVDVINGAQIKIYSCTKDEFDKKELTNKSQAPLSFVKYGSDANTYRLTTPGEVAAGQGSNGETLETTFELGYLTLLGISGYYLVEETKAPEGYNKLEGLQQIEVTANRTVGSALNADKTVFTYGATGENAITILNKKGDKLPSTGGVGTTLFYIVGAVLIIAAGAILVLRKQKAKAQ